MTIRPSLPTFWAVLAIAFAQGSIAQQVAPNPLMDALDRDELKTIFLLAVDREIDREIGSRRFTVFHPEIGLYTSLGPLTDWDRAMQIPRALTSAEIKQVNSRLDSLPANYELRDKLASLAKARIREEVAREDSRSTVPIDARTTRVAVAIIGSSPSTVLSGSEITPAATVVAENKQTPAEPDEKGWWEDHKDGAIKSAAKSALKYAIKTLFKVPGALLAGVDIFLSGEDAGPGSAFKSDAEAAAQFARATALADQRFKAAAARGDFSRNRDGGPSESREKSSERSAPERSAERDSTPDPSPPDPSPPDPSPPDPSPSGGRNTDGPSLSRP